MLLALPWVLAEVGDDALALVEIQRHALVGMVGHSFEAHRHLRHRQQALLQRRHGHRCHRMRVDHAVKLGFCFMDRPVDDEARVIELVI